MTVVKTRCFKLFQAQVQDDFILETVTYFFLLFFPPCASSIMALTVGFSVITSCLLFSALVSAFPAPLDWTQGRRAEAHERLKLHLSLTNPRTADFEQHALSLSTPDHPLYGKYLSREDLAQWMAPADHVLSSALEWIHSANIDDVQAKAYHITLNASIEQAEKLLDTQFYHYTSEDGQEAVRTLKYHVPEPLQQSINMVQPTTRFPQLQSLRSHILPADSSHLEASQEPGPSARTVNMGLAECNLTITPGCLLQLYDMKNTTLPADSNYSMGIAGFLNQYARHADLSDFVDSHASWASIANFTAIGPNPQDDKEDNSEASLDIQYALALAPRVPTIYYSTPGLGPLAPDTDEPSAEDNQNEPFLDHLHYLIDLPDRELPKVVSYSYGENEQTVPRDYAVHVCQMFAQLGARGVSIIVSSGDDGPGSSCMANDGSNRPKFLPTFPASCPWVTAVGGTRFVLPERAAHFSGGGFSDLFYALDYQKAAVASYLEKHGNAFQGYYQAQGRAFPDVSAQSFGFQIISQGERTSVSGTRCVAFILFPWCFGCELSCQMQRSELR